MSFDIFTKLQRAFKPKQRELSLVVTEKEVSLLAEGKQTWHFEWNQVAKIATYKQDLFSVDRICLDFFVEPLQAVCQTNEEMLGFQDLMQRMCQQFPSINKDWYRQVTTPPFDRNSRILFEKQTAT